MVNYQICTTTNVGSSGQMGEDEEGEDPHNDYYDHHHDCVYYNGMHRRINMLGRGVCFQFALERCFISVCLCMSVCSHICLYPTLL